MSRADIGARGAYARWSALSRSVAASVGGYAVAALVSSTLMLALVQFAGFSRAQAVLWASFCSFAFHAMVAIWVFSARSAGQAWTGVGSLAMLCGVLLYFWRP